MSRICTMSPTSHIFIKSGKPMFTIPVRVKRENTWDNFRHTKSVGSMSLLKDVCRLNSPLQRTVKIKCIMPDGGILFREVYQHETRILVYGVLYTKRTDGTFREISKGALTRSVSINKKTTHKKHDGEIKRIEINGKTYRVIRHK